MIKKIFIYLILFIALFGGLFYTFGLPEYFSVATEILIYLFLFTSFTSRVGKGFPALHLGYVLVSFLFISLFSIALNESSSVRAIFSLRLLFRFYFFYLAFILMEPDDDLLKTLNFFVAILLVFQLPVVAAKFMKYGISEKTMGAYAIHDGSMATMLPISFIFYLASYYFLYKSKRKYVLIGIGYVLFSIASMKRAIFFLYPIQFIIIYYYIYVKGTAARISNKMGMLFIFLAITCALSCSILYFNASLNPDKKVGGDIDIGYAFDFAQEYNVGVDGYGYSYGRLETTIRIYKILWNSGFGNLMLGMGPASATQSSLDSGKQKSFLQQQFDGYKILYGLTTMSNIALEYGVLGVAAYSLILLLLARMSWKYYKIEVDPYWKAFAAGSVCLAFSMLFFAFAYHQTAFLGDTMPVLYFYAMAVVYTRFERLTQTSQKI